jgi:hypothetical protein
MSRLAAARTIPVTNNAIQENSRRSLRTLPMVAPVVRQTAAACYIPSATHTVTKTWQRPARIVTRAAAVATAQH